MQIPGGFFPPLSDVSAAATRDIMGEVTAKRKWRFQPVIWLPNAWLGIECDQRDDAFHFHKHILHCHAAIVIKLSNIAGTSVFDVTRRRWDYFAFCFGSVLCRMKSTELSLLQIWPRSNSNNIECSQCDGLDPGLRWGRCQKGKLIDSRAFFTFSSETESADEDNGSYKLNDLTRKWCNQGPQSHV